MMLRACIALLAGSCIAVLTALAGAAAAGTLGLPPLPGAISLLAGGLGALIVACRLTSLPALPRPSNGVDWLVIGLYTLFAGRSFLWLIFERGDEIAFLNSNNLGDLSLHITYIQSLARELIFWPDNPIFTGTPLHYPFGTDLLNALLLQAGVPLERGLVWVGLTGALLTGVALWSWGRSVAIIGFLCNGGLAAWQFFQTGIIRDYQTTEAWKSIPLALFVTQRGLLYAIPVGLLLLWSWKTRLLEENSNDKPAPLPLWLELLLYSTLPLFHLHTFLFLSLMLGSWAVAGALRWKWGRTSHTSSARAADRHLAFGSLRLIALAFLPATLFVALVTGFDSATSSLHWKPGWMQGDSGYSPLFFWLFNFGFWPLCLVALLIWLAIQNRQRDQSHHLEARRNLLLTLPALAIFLLGCFVMFATWEWDNTKLFLWSYLVLLLPIGDLLRRATLPVQTVAWCCLFFSGFFSLLGGLGITDNRTNGYTLARRSELMQLRQLLHSSALHQDTRARIAFAPTYNHPLLLLGYHGVAGYEGHLYSHGLDYKPTYQHLEHLLKGTPGWENAARTLGVSILFWGTKEESVYGNAPQLWRSRAKPLAQTAHGTFYSLD